MTPDSAEQARESDTTRDADWKAHPLDIAVLISERDSLRAELSKAGPKWWDCATHGPATANAWGCPECVREMRAELAAVRADAERLRSVGGRLSNVAFNWAQSGAGTMLKTSDCKMLDALRREWDDAARGAGGQQ